MTQRSVTRLALAGSLWLILAGCVAVFAPLGTETSTVGADSVDGSGEVIISETSRRVSLWDTQHSAAVGVLIGVICFAIVAFALVRWGGRIGGAVVVLVGSLGFLASMLSVGVFLLPGIAMLAASAILAEVVRSEAGSRRRPPPPAGYGSPDVIAHLDS